ncbi:uncharacterized protein LOC116294448 [Actinia tenebrosa]|uniref:Uncharacterized protein LOC116294448 n=1 Tax=Actinia tenebrosa TaxID=6105 RepID=A0A6P8HZ10_ACTTE|nr:uncharacterized protein LOC116294448 [Actinia tenebrosa]
MMYRSFRAVLCILFLCSVGKSSFKNALFKSHLFHTVPSSEFINVLNVRSVIECGLSCMRSQRCVSFNFALEANIEGNYVCQLLPTDLIHHGLAATPFFHHFELVVTDPCHSSPCLNGGKCSANSGGSEYSCFCPPWYAGKTCEKANWVKINTTPLCFGSRDDAFSPFVIQKTGLLSTMKLVHVRGNITCDVTNANGWNNWGCLGRHGNHMYMSVIITTRSDSIVLPERKYFMHNDKVYNFPGCNASSPELIFPKLASPLYVMTGQQYRIWFAQDLRDFSETNNGGTNCVDVFGLYE